MKNTAETPLTLWRALYSVSLRLAMTLLFTRHRLTVFVISFSICFTNLGQVISTSCQPFALVGSSSYPTGLQPRDLVILCLVSEV